MTLHNLTDALKDDLSHAQEKSARGLRTGRAAVADAIDSAASRVHAGAEHVSDAARATTDRMEASATWIRETSGRDLLDDLEGMVRAHPVRTVVGAVVVGFLAGRMLRAR